MYERWRGYLFDPDLKAINIRYEKMRKYIEEEGKGKTILDLGCADGSLLEPLTQHNTVHGVEISESLSEAAKKRGLLVTTADVEQEGIPFPSETFDVVVAGEILEHIVETDFFLTECNRVLKPGGKLVLAVPNINTFFSPFLMFLFDYPPPLAARYQSEHIRDFTFSTLRIALQSNGFTIEKKRGTLFYIPVFPNSFLKLRSFLADRLLRSSEKLILKARKRKYIPYKEEEVLQGIESRSLVKHMPLLKWFIR